MQKGGWSISGAIKMKLRNADDLLVNTTTNQNQANKQTKADNQITLKIIRET